MANPTRISCDYLVIGSGLAGLTAALKAAELGQVLIVTKRELEESNSRYAQGGIACVSTEDDSFGLHVQDTLEAGAGLCDEAAVRAIVEAAPARLQELIDRGISFTRRKEMVEDETGNSLNEYDLAREGGHSRRRIYHAGDITGADVIRVMSDHCRRHPNITILENHIAVDLISTRHLEWQGENLCLGAYVMDTASSEVKTVISKATFLATGGAGKVYLYTTNPDVADGDGLAMAWRAYAEIRNMEFYQFHPTCLYHPYAKSFLISEAVRGEGAILKIKQKGEYIEFMQKYHPLKSLAPRDVVARAIDNELKRTGQDCAWLDIRHMGEEFLKRRFPNIYAKCMEFGINMATDLIPVVPAAHYCCGGVKTDVQGITTVGNLYAIGEVACTGLHGANRLASNSLLEALVMAHNAVEHCRTTAPTLCNPIAIPDWSSDNAVEPDEQIVISHNWDEIRRFMWDYVGIVRTNKRLERAKHRIRLIRGEIEKYYWDFLLTPDLVELRNLASVAEMIIDCAQHRQESRGLHYNTDYPWNSHPGGKNTVLRRPTKAVVRSE
jgi:L-aspartate oxidase